MSEKLRKKSQKNRQNRGILVTTYIFLAIFVGLFAYMIYFNVVKADDVINNSYNKRQGVLESKVIRGSILTSDGTVIASTATDDNGNDVRYYPCDNLFAHVAGYINNGGYGLESNAGYYMLKSNQNFFEQIANDISGQRNQGDNLVTTLDYGLQKAASDALGSSRGAVIVMEPSTGKILAMVSKPDFNPNTLAAEWDTITAEGADSVLVNRATQGLYPPGSTFKIVTLLEYYKEHKGDYDNYSYDCTGSVKLGDSTMSCAEGIAHGELNLLDSFYYSCNTSFINIGLSLDVNSFAATADKLLFNSDIPLDMEYNRSQFVLNEDSGRWETAQTSFGQGKTLVTPMELAMIDCAIANNGVLMKPYVTDHVESAGGVTVKSFKPSEYGSLMTEDEAAFMKDCMTYVGGSRYAELLSDQYTVAAKSGTAQFGTQGYEHTLLVSFSPAEAPEIAVVTVVEGGPSQTTTAKMVSRQIYDYYYSQKNTIANQSY